MPPYYQNHPQLFFYPSVFYYWLFIFYYPYVKHMWDIWLVLFLLSLFIKIYLETIMLQEPLSETNSSTCSHPASPTFRTVRSPPMCCTEFSNSAHNITLNLPIFPNLSPAPLFSPPFLLSLCFRLSSWLSG